MSAYYDKGNKKPMKWISYFHSLWANFNKTYQINMKTASKAKPFISGTKPFCEDFRAKTRRKKKLITVC